MRNTSFYALKPDSYKNTSNINLTFWKVLPQNNRWLFYINFQFNYQNYNKSDIVYLIKMESFSIIPHTVRALHILYRPNLPWKYFNFGSLYKVEGQSCQFDQPSSYHCRFFQIRWRRICQYGQAPLELSSNQCYHSYSLKTCNWIGILAWVIWSWLWRYL